MTGTPATIVQGGRAKAYRPLPLRERRHAFRAGTDAYARGEYFLAHEELEPAWMGTADVAERELLQGLIKLSACFVHACRGNALGQLKNLRGARERLAAAQLAGVDDLGLDLPALVAEIDRRLDALGRAPELPILDAPPLPWRSA